MALRRDHASEAENDFGAMSLAESSRQISLFNLCPTAKMGNNALARNAYGQLAQDVVCAVLRLNPIPIDGSKTVCCDAELDGQHFEIKSVRRGCKVVLYDWRMKKEGEAVPNLKYAILVHDNRKAESIAGMLETMKAKPPTLIIADASQIHAWAKFCPLNIMKAGAKPSGYTRPGYSEGYRNLPVTKLLKCSSVLGRIRGEVYFNHIIDVNLRLLK